MRTDGAIDEDTLLRDGMLAAFHGAPAGPRLMAGLAGRPWGRWIAAVLAGAAGRYAAALELTGPADDDPLTAALLAATRGAVCRQLGRYDEAERADRRALEDAAAADPGPPGLPTPAEAAADAALGFTADAVGRGEHAHAAARLVAAEAAVRAAGTWRPAVRLGWVRAEVALLGGDAGPAVVAGERSCVAAAAAHAPRHEVKSLLFTGVARIQVGDATGGIADLRSAAERADQQGLRPLSWPAHAVLSRLALPAEQVEVHARAARRTLQAIAADLPAELRAEWLAAPDRAVILG